MKVYPLFSNSFLLIGFQCFTLKKLPEEKQMVDSNSITWKCQGHEKMCSFLFPTDIIKYTPCTATASLCECSLYKCPGWMLLSLHWGQQPNLFLCMLAQAPQGLRCVAKSKTSLFPFTINLDQTVSPPSFRLWIHHHLSLQQKVVTWSPPWSPPEVVNTIQRSWELSSSESTPSLKLSKGLVTLPKH